jgi:hyaluronan synthase
VTPPEALQAATLEAPGPHGPAVSTLSITTRPSTSITADETPWRTLAVFGVVVAAAVAWFAWRGLPVFTWYGAVVAVLLGGKLALSLVPAQRWQPAPAGVRTCVVIPIYNEDPAFVRQALASIDAQTYPPTFVVVVDDGSTDPSARDVAAEWAAGRPNAVVLHQPNAGKREAMAAAFRLHAGEVDVWVCVDSDTRLEPDAIRRGLEPLNDPRVAAVTGTVIAANVRGSLLARLVDTRYVAAFLTERAAYSRLGSVLCVCGSLGFWRAEIIAEHLDDFLGQTFLGEPCTYGDDRHLTNLSLLHGRVVLARHSIARTAVPERLGHFLRQQARWGRSFLRESVWSLSHLTPRRVGWWLSLIEVTTWGVLSSGLVFALAVRPFTVGHHALVDYAVWAALMAYARSAAVFSLRRPDLPRWQQVASYLLAPAYGAIHLTVLLPLRLYSLATIRSTRWGTRAGGAEVTAA